MARLIVASNRLPVIVAGDGPEPTLSHAPGGLATGMSAPHAQMGGVWVGWPGEVAPGAEHAVAQLLGAERMVPVFLGRREIERYYEGFCNGVLWPLLHWMVDRIPPHGADWVAYRDVNRRFAEAIAAVWQPGDLVWVHDYHLMLVPSMLRERIPGVRVGFFLHVPFPSAEIYRTLPRREELLRGVLGADLVGFHDPSYAEHFASAARAVLGVPTSRDRVMVGTRSVRIGAFPMGVDAQAFSAWARSPEADREVARLRVPGVQTILGIDRLDYTKGLRRRLLSIGRLFERRPDLRTRVRYLQIAVPSRERVSEYERHRNEVERLIGRLNGAFSTPDATPIRYLYRSFQQAELAALYRGADLMVVTPVRDGMNLVAKEFVASRVDDRGALVLSEFAGAARELREALVVNPFDLDGVAAAIERGLEMPVAEQAGRMRAMRRRVQRNHVHRWASDFIEAMGGELAAAT